MITTEYHSKTDPSLVRRGEVWLVADGDYRSGPVVSGKLSKMRPHLIIQSNIGNSSNSNNTIGLPISTLRDSTKKTSTRYLDLVLDEGKLRSRSYVSCDRITQIDKTRLVRSVGKVGDIVMRHISDMVIDVLEIKNKTYNKKYYMYSSTYDKERATFDVTGLCMYKGIEYYSTYSGGVTAILRTTTEDGEGSALAEITTLSNKLKLSIKLINVDSSNFLRQAKMLQSMVDNFMMYLEYYGVFSRGTDYEIK